MTSSVSTRPSPAKREPWTVLAAIAAAGCVGEIAPMVVPLFLGSVAADFGVTEGAAGIAPGLEVGGIATGAVLFALLGRRIHPRIAVWIALALVIVGQMASMVVTWWTAFVVVRAAVGFGEGVLVASASIQASLTPRPHRAFSMLLTVIIGTFIGVSFVIPSAVGSFGSRGAFGVLLGVAVAAVPLLVRFPARRGRDPSASTSWMSSRASRLLTAAILVYVAFSALWTYAGQIGLSLGMSLAAVGIVVTVSGALGAAGPFGAGLLGLRWGHSVPLLGSLIVVASAVAMLAHAWSVVVFAGTTILAMTSFMFFVTYLRGLMGALEPSGRVVGVGVGVVTFGGAVGPFAAGLLLDSGHGYGSLGLMALACSTVAMVLAAPVARFVDRHTNLEHPDRIAADRGMARSRWSTDRPVADPRPVGRSTIDGG